MLFFKKRKLLKPLPPALHHVAFIMDGNGRWAKRRGLPREAGHPVGAKAFKNLLLYCRERGLEVATFYAFSTENWRRPKSEVDAIMKLFRAYLTDAMEELKDSPVRVVFLGDRSVLDLDMQTEMERLEKASANYRQRLQIAINYGGRDEIVHAVNQAISDGISPVTQDAIAARLYTGDCPPPDLIVRTGGEQRMSNFLMWQSAYSEFYFTNTLWPDFGPAEFEEAVADFEKRQRRYGGI